MDLRITLCFLLGYVPIAPAAQLTFEQLNKGPNSFQSLLPTQKVVFSDGRYAIIEGKSVSDKVKAKKATATCPAGMKAASAGFAAASGAGEPPDYRVILSTPTSQGAGWSVYARFDGKGDSLAAAFDWELRIHLVCLKPS